MLVKFTGPDGGSGYVSAEDVTLVAPAHDAQTQSPIMGACVVKLRNGDAVGAREPAGDVAERVNDALVAATRGNHLDSTSRLVS